MTKEEFRKLTKKELVILDGATGSNLMKAGMPKGVCTEQWICENPQALMKLQKEYCKAGSQIVYAPTFSANKISLSNYGLENQVYSLNKQLVEISRSAVGTACMVAGDLTTTGKPDIEYEILLDAYKEQIIAQLEAGVDLLVAETMLGITEPMAVLDAARELCDLPVMCTLTVESDGSLFFGGNIYDAVESLEAMGADAVGINCSTGPDQLFSVVENIRKRIEIPLIVKPNAGNPVIDETGLPIYSMNVGNFVHYMKRLIDVGANLVGGCCGTTPEYIAELVKWKISF